MSGLVRNFITLIFALINRGRVDVRAKVSCGFWITPFDCGLRLLKSDKHLQLIESAQVDFLVKTSLITHLRGKGISFVNASQLVKFIKPIKVFSRPRVET